MVIKYPNETRAIIVAKKLRRFTSKKQAEILQRFFKTGIGEYGEGDIFLGVKVPDIRRVAKEGRDLSLVEIKELLYSKIHEERLLALLILVGQFESSTEDKRKGIYNFYLKNTRQINNWDLVDLSAPKIVGAYLIDKSPRILYELAESNSIWEKRVAIIATYTFIKNNKFDNTMLISNILLNDKHDLIHKAVGWMLREVGKKSLLTEERFLKKHYKNMPRTMLRYAIEKFSESKRQGYLKGKIY